MPKKPRPSDSQEQDKFSAPPGQRRKPLEGSGSYEIVGSSVRRRNAIARVLLERERTGGVTINLPAEGLENLREATSQEMPEGASPGPTPLLEDFVITVTDEDYSTADGIPEPGAPESVINDDVTVDLSGSLALTPQTICERRPTERAVAAGTPQEQHPTSQTTNVEDSDNDDDDPFLKALMASFSEEKRNS